MSQQWLIFAQSELKRDWWSYSAAGCIHRLYLQLLARYFSRRLRKMSKRYALGVKRYMSVRKQDGELTVTIAEDGSEKSAILPARRWVRFVAAMNDVEESLKQMLAKQYVKFNQHVGGGWYLSVTTGYLCVDLRRW
jgi:hypothetical protein